MADMYDIAVAKMKIGVAFPIYNESFRYWDNPGTWTLPTAWTNSGVTIARSFTDAFDGDESAVDLSDTAMPNDHTNNIASQVARFWNDNRAGFASLSCYYSIAMRLISVTTPGAAFNCKAVIEWDSAEAFTTPGSANLAVVSTVDGATVLRTGVAAMAGITTSDRFSRAKLILKDAAAARCVFDSIGVMFNPFSTAAGYYQFTGFAEIPSQGFRRFTQDSVNPVGSTQRFDPSGGAEKLRLTCQFEDELPDFYENMKRFYNINHGMPGVPPLPLLIEPNLPGYPPTFRCNIVGDEFPLDRQRARGNFYGGTITFEAVDA